MPPDADVDIDFFDEIEEMSGKLGTSSVDDKLMKSVLSNDKQKIDEGKIISDAINNGIGSFTPDIFFENIIKKYQTAKKLYGDRLLRMLTGYDAEYIERNHKIPEFQQHVKKNIKASMQQLAKDGLIDREGSITERGFELSSVVVYLEELEALRVHGILGEKINKRYSVYGDANEVKSFKKGIRYKDIDLRSTLKLAIRRGRSRIEASDIKAVDRKSKGIIEIIYAIDASASMKGKKIEMAKKAGVALAFKAIEERNKVGLIVFGDDVKQEIAPTLDFGTMLQQITRVRASTQTNISRTIAKSYELFGRDDNTKHLVLITDAMPTEGDDPAKETLEACAEVSRTGITISLIGINLNEEGKKLAERIAELGSGRLYIANDVEDLDILVLQDYAEQG